MAYTLHSRNEWLVYSSHGMSGPSQDRTAVKWIVVHYNGGNADLDGPDDIFQDADYARVIARMNDQYWNSRGYALGYNFGLGPDGDLWQIRGTDIRCAANGCQTANVPGVAIQVTTTAVTAPPTNAQIDALKNRWVPWLRTQYPKTLDVVGHRDVNPLCDNPTGTACPGPQLYPLVQQGYFDTPQQQDWFDMATEAELRTIVKDEVAKTGAIVWAHPMTLIETGATQPAHVLQRWGLEHARQANVNAQKALTAVEFQAAVTELQEALDNLQVPDVAKDALREVIAEGLTRTTFPTA